MRLLSKITPGILIDAAIISALAFGAAVIAPKIIYSILIKDGVFNDN